MSIIDRSVIHVLAVTVGENPFGQGALEKFIKLLYCAFSQAGAIGDASLCTLWSLLDVDDAILRVDIVVAENMPIRAFLDYSNPSLGYS